MVGTVPLAPAVSLLLFFVLEARSPWTPRSEASAFVSRSPHPELPILFVGLGMVQGSAVVGGTPLMFTCRISLFIFWAYSRHVGSLRADSLDARWRFFGVGGWTDRIWLLVGGLRWPFLCRIWCFFCTLQLEARTHRSPHGLQTARESERNGRSPHDACRCVWPCIARCPPWTGRSFRVATLSDRYSAVLVLHVHVAMEHTR